MTQSTVRERALVAGLVLFFAAGAFPVLRPLAVQDLVGCYPHVTSDSFDWIRNGLFWAGEDVVPSYRPPGLPWIIAVLYRAKALPLLPYLNFAALAACAALLYRFVRARYGAGASALAVLVFGTNDFVLDHTKYVMVEIYGALAILLAAFFYFRSGEDERAYVPFGLSLGLGFLFHYVTLPAGVGFAAAVLLTRRPHLRRLWLWLGLAVAAVPPAGWLLFRSWAYRHAPPGVLLVHIIEPLFGLQRDNIGFYAVA
ncbi:MAG TPA: glycosyltransferase family 39 protein, partial [Thermoanaerobaculia bacterium]|nr:glycosyltransferase family 39 protein [Thermoanaerobaculia bacterium]